jgi:uncharacterized protein (TIGR02147 family)
VYYFGNPATVQQEQNLTSENLILKKTSAGPQAPKTDFRAFLQHTLQERILRNPRYSIRAFARALQINDSSLSQILRGKRTISPEVIKKLGLRLSLSPDTLDTFVRAAEPLERAAGESRFEQLSIDTFHSISDWYHDAILEMTRLTTFRPDPKWISSKLGITQTEASGALARLVRLNLVKVDESGRWSVVYMNTTTILDSDYTDSASRNYQKQLLEKSHVAVEAVVKSSRDHTSIVFAIDESDIPEAIERVKRFRREMLAFFERPKARPQQVYALQFSLFPLTENISTDEEEVSIPDSISEGLSHEKPIPTA